MATELILILAASLMAAHLSRTSALPSETITNAADTLSNSGYMAMSLTLNLVSDTLLSHPTSATIFTPPDAAFSDSGQPSLSLLQLHFSPLAFSLSSLASLPFGTKIPTLSPATFLTVTKHSSSDPLSLNDVKIVGSPIFDDGLLVVFGIENFFDPNFAVPVAPVQSPTFDHCTAPFRGDGNFSFHDGANVLISRGYSVMASFLNLQLLGSQSRPTLTVFAPVDEVMVDYSGRFPDYPSLFLRHVLPCKISWRDIVNIDNESILDTYLGGFKVKINTSGNTFKVNEVSLTFPDLYYSDWLVIHGVREILSLQKPAEDVDDVEENPFDDFPAKNSGDELTAAGPDRTDEF